MEVGVRKLLVASVALGLLISSSTNAQSFKPRKNGPDYLGLAQTFHCEPAWQSNNPIVASDPVYMVMVRIEFKNGDDVASDLKVVHVAESGETYNRARQYIRSDLITTPGYRDYNWHGTYLRDYNVTMHGELFEKDDSHYGPNRWFYNEEQFRNGQKSTEYHTVCDKTDEDMVD